MTRPEETAAERHRRSTDDARTPFERAAGNVVLFGGAGGVILAVIAAVGSYVWATEIKKVTTPIVNAIAEERAARVAGEQALAGKLSEMSRDRLDILEVITLPVGSAERDAAARTVFRKWAAQDSSATQDPR